MFETVGTCKNNFVKLWEVNRSSLAIVLCWLRVYWSRKTCHLFAKDGFNRTNSGISGNRVCSNSPPL